MMRLVKAYVLEIYNHINKPLNSMHMNFGYRICCDNIDKTCKTQYMCLDQRNKSLHYCHSYAVQNRIDVSQIDDCVVDRMQDVDQISRSILPSCNDDKTIRDNIAILILLI